MFRTLPVIILAFLLWFTPLAAANLNVKVIALFTDKALLQIGSETKILAKGESFKGVTLQSANARGAVVLTDGKLQKIGINQSIQYGFKKPDLSTAIIYPDSQGMYFVKGQVNQTKVHFLVDTGATYLTMSGKHAKKIGIDFLKGATGYANTASGTVRVFQVKLDSVSIGDIQVKNVDASVIAGNHPLEILLGNSFLKHTKLQRIGVTMELQHR
ncbi:MAG: aspartyl protease family protein [Gammaproteobacteria bacterium]|jgi:aspartyl protease family protein